MVDSSVTRPTTVQATVSVVAPSVAAGMASDRALPAKVKPIIMATGPVIEAGRMVSTTFLPKNFTSRPAAMEMRPEKMMPNWAYWMASVGRIPSTFSKPSASHMLAIAVR